MKELFLLIDYRDGFYSSTKYRGAFLDTKYICEEFLKYEVKVNILNFRDVDFLKYDFKNKYILYQSSEDPGLHYKEYIEDILLGIYLQGGILVPRFEFFRAHHNKNFMEILRQISRNKEINSLKSYLFGTYEDYLVKINLFTENSFVLKEGSTSKSKGVYLLSTDKEKSILPEKISHSFSFQNVKYFLEFLKTGKKCLPISNNRKKFIVQEFLPNLNGDYRVIIYGKKFYLLYRENRPKDFRASGSMRFNFDIEPPKGIFEFAQKVIDIFDVPYISLDIGYIDNIFHLIEFQFVSFGQYTVEKSEFYYSFSDGTWEKVYEKPIVERELVRSVVDYIKK